MKEDVQRMVEECALTDYVSLLGAMPPDEVREHMERSQILLFTSDQNEGWGAVLNEGMNSACTVVANAQIGSVPFLLEDGKNGRVYYKNDVQRIAKMIEELLDNEALTAELGKNAYNTIVGEWSASVAADRLTVTCKKLLGGEKEFFGNGPCSEAKIKVKKG